DEDGRYNESPEMLAQKLARFAEYGWLNIVGGCCGTTPEHIRTIAKAVSELPLREPVRARSSAISGLEALTIDDDKRPILVGERTNVIGSKKFKNLIIAGEFEQGAEIGRKQIRGGAQIIDVCLANPDRDEKTDMILFLDILTKKIKAPLMIDSTDPAVIEEALKRSPGKAIINSINLEDGEERFAEVVPLAKHYGAALVVGTIDEDKEAGMGVTRARKLEIARRSFILLTGEFGYPAEDIIFDPLTFPCATGDKNYFGSAEETIEGVRLIKDAMPGVKTILGVSNVSFGLPPAGREVLNAVFLRHCVEAGLDLAIVNAQKLARFATISDEEKGLANSLLFYKGPDAPGAKKGEDPIAAFAAHFRKAAPKAEQAAAAAELKRNELPVRDRIARNIVEGLKEGLTADLDALRIEEGLRPLEIVNGPLMQGMDEVGRLFAANEMIVAEVLQSAEVMKAAVTFLEPLMDPAAAAPKGRFLLATVKGDVHDIGKNLVHIIFKNNGYDVVDLGIKVSPEVLIEAAKKNPPDIIGLSGLLVKSAQQMAATASDLKSAGIRAPILVGGAALSPRFTASRIAPRHGEAVLYAKDAMKGLDLANRLRDPGRAEALLRENREKQRELVAASERRTRVESPSEGGVKGSGVTIRRDHDIPSPPDIRRHVFPEFDLEEIFRYV
ncbi:MAG: dihydropteroate synthase, partial [Elusimicrobiota bacterium]